MDSLTWLMATGNPGKVLELSRILSETPVCLKGLSDLGIDADCPESGQSFLENAKQKAEFYFNLAKMPTLADDSGLEVDHLDGRPGIYSARFGGLTTHEEKCRYLLSLLEGVQPEYRTARFYCAAVFYDGQTFISNEGTIEGFIKSTPQGSGGFGYDPIFSPTMEGESLAEIELARKNQISHRGIAFRGLLKRLEEEGRIPHGK